VFYGVYGDNTGVGGVTANVVTDNAATVKEGQWYNLIYTYGAGVGKFYLNGTLINTDTSAITFTPNLTNLYIGRHDDSEYPYYFNGIIDEVRIYNRALNPCEVSYLNNLTY
jgi:Concanavalin A-like lectin/glucanases superfamily